VSCILWITLPLRPWITSPQSRHIRPRKNGKSQLYSASVMREAGRYHDRIDTLAPAPDFRTVFGLN
jgi:hypothetical protein